MVIDACTHDYNYREYLPKEVAIHEQRFIETKIYNEVSNAYSRNSIIDIVDKLSGFGIYKGEQTSTLMSMSIRDMISALREAVKIQDHVLTSHYLRIYIDWQNRKMEEIRRKGNN